MLCPECKRQSKVVSTRQAPDGTLRRHHCLWCPHRFTTREVLVPERERGANRLMRELAHAQRMEEKRLQREKTVTDVKRLSDQGLIHAEIAAKLDISLSTVRVYLKK